MPQGTAATVSGTVEYASSFMGAFQAVLEKEGDEWMLDSIFVNVPPAKLGQ
jgi:hypothetical protein